MFHLPGCRAALGSRDWLLPFSSWPPPLPAAPQSVLCAFPFLWSNFAEAKRVGMESPGLLASSSVPGPSSPKILWRLARNRSPHAIELADLKSIYSQIPNAIDSKISGLFSETSVYCSFDAQLAHDRVTL